MKISHKLMLIVMLTVFEVSVTLWCAFQISKGATFHQLNFLHVKYNQQFAQQVNQIELGNAIDIATLNRAVAQVRQQPFECLELAGWADMQLMKWIGTYKALDLCRKDLADADEVLRQLHLYSRGQITENELLPRLREAVVIFSENSAKFEVPITRTVDFILHLFIPLIIFISLVNISFIAYLSKTISGSISRTIRLLSSNHADTSFKQYINKGVSGELKELLTIAEKRIENDLLNIENNEKLQKIVDEKTASLQHTNQELEQFSYRTSHDLKAPLTRSKRLCRLILEDIEQGEYNYTQANLHSVIEQMSGLELLVEDLLSLARADLVEVASETFNILDLVQEINLGLVSMYHPLYDDIEFIVEANNCSHIFSDKIRVRQIIENLLSNAYKYADRQKATNWVKFSVELIENNYMLSIEDNGIGIPAEHHKDLFAKFKRFHPEIGSGTGLGMSIVKRHVEKMHGNIAYLPTDVGSTFVITIPSL